MMAHRMFLLVLVVNGCGQGIDPTSTDANTPYAQAATIFVEALVERQFAEAHSMMARNLQDALTVDELRTQYESMIEYGTGPVRVEEPVTSMEEWPDKQPDDVGWVYVSVSGSDFVEAVTVVVSREDGELRIREIEWGRP